MKIAFSPCPNDTFIFHAWVHGLVPNAPALDVTFADINITNELAINNNENNSKNNNNFDIMKISYAALPWVLSEYALLPCGGAMGRGCGPLVLAKDSTSDASYLTNKRVAIPSERSTAYLLFRLWATQQVSGKLREIVIMPFDKIMPAVADGSIDAGLVIHEARFTYQNYGLHKLADLGNWWEADTGLPIPLGAIIARRTLDLPNIINWIRTSVEYAWANPNASDSFVMQHAQELSNEVAKSHIELYVNKYSSNLGQDGYNAVMALLGRAADEGLVPKLRAEDIILDKNVR